MALTPESIRGHVGQVAPQGFIPKLVEVTWRNGDRQIDRSTAEREILLLNLLPGANGIKLFFLRH